ncbi:MAG: MerR family transcriptional regulator [Clostridiales bacterium]|nr:MerR family transcriptional regulator [Clostridiales bacterium]
MNKIKLSIGRFSTLCRVTVKTLKHYEKMGVLIPHQVDEWTHYRYYDVSQMEQLLRIKQFQSMGFTLTQIRKMQQDGEDSLSVNDIVAAMNQVKAKISELVLRQNSLQDMLDAIKKQNQEMEVTIKSLPEIVVASHRSVISSYQDLFDLLPNKIGPEMARLGCTCPEPGYGFTLEHDGEYTGHNIDIEYCEQVDKAMTDSDLVQFKTIPAVPKALIYKHYGAYENLPASWAKLYAYMEQNDIKAVDLPRFNQIDGIWNKDSIDEWLTEIQVPIE